MSVEAIGNVLIIYLDKDSFLLHAYYVHGVGEIAVLLFGKKLYTWHA